MKSSSLPFQFQCLMLIMLVVASAPAMAQFSSDTLRLDSAMNWARKHFQFNESALLHERIGQLKSRQIQSTLYPQLSVGAQASYQSEVVSFPFELPMIEPLDLPHTRTRLDLNVQQTIYNGGITETQKKMAQTSRQLEREQLDVAKQQLDKQVSELYFRILLLQNTEALIRSHLWLLRTKRQDLQNNFEGGLVDKSAVLQLDNRILELSRDSVKTKHSVSGLKSALSELVGRDVGEHKLRKPDFVKNLKNREIDDPQLDVLQLQKELLTYQGEQSRKQRLPQLNAFLNAGFGYPNPFNFFDDNFSPFFLGGLQFRWPIYDWGRHQMEKEVLQHQSLLLDHRKQQILSQAGSQAENIRAHIRYLEEAVALTRDMLDRQREIRQLASLKLDRGLIVSSNYLEAEQEERNTALSLIRYEIEIAKHTLDYLSYTDQPYNH